jgi:hypothetical protein
MHTAIAVWLELNFLFIAYRVWAGGLLRDSNET